MKSVLFSKKNTPDPELLALKAELWDVQNELAQAYRRFDQAVDPELVESWIFQISALNARCNYLIRAIKSRSPEAVAAFTPIPPKDAVSKKRTCRTADNLSSQSNSGGYNICENEEDPLWT